MSTIQTPQPPSHSDDLVPERFRASKATLAVDKIMTYAIRLGGVMVIAAVFGIFVFIFSQIWPLFGSAKVEELESFPIAPGDYKILGIDEWSALPFVVGPDGGLTFFDIEGDRPPQAVDFGFPEGTAIAAVAYRPENQLLIYGTELGEFSLVNINYKMQFGENQQVVQNAEAGPLYKLGPEGARMVDIAYGDSGALKLAVAVMEIDGRTELHAATLTQKRPLIGSSAIEIGNQFNLTDLVQGDPQSILVDRKAEVILLATTDGNVHYLHRQGENFTHRQTIRPFGGLDNTDVASMDFLLGDVSVVFTNSDGVNYVFSLYIPENGRDRLFGKIKEFPPLPTSADFFSMSLRNKGFLLGSGNFASLRYSTTQDIRWEAELPYEIELAILSGKNDRIIFLDTESKLHTLRLYDPHPATNFQSLFGKIWYEGSSEPKFEWQSTGGSVDFEPKLSQIPLIIGTLKGTLYAMLFAVPIALLAAIYTSQFLQPNTKRFVKPTMEIMASLPSVVLGFLAALWLAPLLDTKVPSLILIIIMVPTLAFLMGWGWSNTPKRFRLLIQPGNEWLVFMPVLLLVGWMGWIMGPWLESWAFVVTEPSGLKIADFRRWWPEVTGTPFNQRNSLVVGFMMGFAVIPIIFTVSEDALSNVPNALRSGSLALGASRWQTAMRIVLPTASAGIFSAVMIGLGRAVGETMIVVMATGNTPIMDFNIFSGMRTLAANIAVELPEAPHGGTLYRTLFLGAMVLFMMTFLVNTVAEVLRQHLREKYKTI